MCIIVVLLHHNRVCRRIIEWYIRSFWCPLQRSPTFLLILHFLYIIKNYNYTRLSYWELSSKYFIIQRLILDYVIFQVVVTHSLY